MDAAVVKLNTLADTVRTAAQHHDLFLVGGGGLALAAFSLVGRVHVGGVGRELGRAGVHPFVNRPHTERLAFVADGGVRGFELARQTAVRKTFLLERAQSGRIDLVQRHGFKLKLDLDDLLDLHQKPGVDLGQRKHLVHAHAQGKSITDVPDALGAGRAQLFFKHFAVLRLFVHAVHANFQAAQGFLERLLEGAAHGHHFAHRLHLGGQAGICSRKFFKRKTWDLGDDVIDAGLKARRRGAAGDVIAQFVEGVADSQLGRDLGDRETCGLRSQCGRTRNARVHLDHDHATVHRVDRELHV